MKVILNCHHRTMLQLNYSIEGSERGENPLHCCRQGRRQDLSEGVSQEGVASRCVRRAHAIT